MRVILIILISLWLWLSGGCAPRADFDSSLSSIVKPYRFSIAQWEFRTLPNEVKEWLWGSRAKIDDPVGLVTEYFSLVEQTKALSREIEATGAGSGQGDAETRLNRLREQKAAPAPSVERILEEQIKEALVEMGILRPVDTLLGVEVTFPPVSFKLEKPPHLLVISPRDRIERLREATLQPDITLEEIQAIEGEADKLGVSSLVVELGGMATYPTFVTDDASLRFTLDTIAEEWLHQHLAFWPLGFRYLMHSLGLSRNSEIATMNETLAGMVSQEIGTTVCQKYYPRLKDEAGSEPATGSEFDFNREMRAIRKTVDEYLARGEIELAEEFMEQKRKYLAANGYYIRKLNQAYFAFHGTYADRPAFIGPIGLELKELRAQYVSLRDFLSTVAQMTSHEDLTAALKEKRAEEEPGPPLLKRAGSWPACREHGYSLRHGSWYIIPTRLWHLRSLPPRS